MNREKTKDIFNKVVLVGSSSAAIVSYTVGSEVLAIVFFGVALHSWFNRLAKQADDYSSSHSKLNQTGLNQTGTNSTTKGNLEQNRKNPAHRPS